MKARGRLVAAVLAVLLVLALPAGASAGGAHPRHVEFRPASTRGFAYFGERDGYELGITFGGPDYAVLEVGSFDPETQAGAFTSYGAHFHGSLAGGRVRADFGAIGSISLRFRPDGKVRSHSLAKNCQGGRPRTENGHFVGRIDLRGEGGYFHISTTRVGGYRDRTFRVHCRVKGARPEPPTPSLVEAVEPSSGFLVSGNGGTLALLEAIDREDGREVALRALHKEGAPPGAEVAAGSIEYQGSMPVGRDAWASESPAGTLATSLPGEHPATATLKPAAPFMGEARYLATGPTSHEWAGDLAVQFPGLTQTLVGPGFFTSLCVVSPLQVRYGCDFLWPDWQGSE